MALRIQGMNAIGFSTTGSPKVIGSDTLKIAGRHDRFHRFLHSDGASNKERHRDRNTKLHSLIDEHPHKGRIDDMWQPLSAIFICFKVFDG